MALSPFQPKNALPEWKMIYDKLLGLEVEDLITYNELDSILDRPFRSNRSPFERAREELEDTRKRTLANVRGKGYRVVKAEEQWALQTSHRLRGARQVRKAIRKVVLVRGEELEPAIRDRFENQALKLQQVETALRHQNKRLRVVESALQETKAEVDKRSDELQSEIERINDVLRRHKMIDDES